MFWRIWWVEFLRLFFFVVDVCCVGVGVVVFCFVVFVFVCVVEFVGVGFVEFIDVDVVEVFGVQDVCIVVFFVIVEVVVVEVVVVVQVVVVCVCFIVFGCCCCFGQFGLVGVVFGEVFGLWYLFWCEQCVVIGEQFYFEYGGFCVVDVCYGYGLVLFWVVSELIFELQ